MKPDREKRGADPADPGDLGVHKPAIYLNGSSLANLTGARVRVEERLSFSSAEIAEAFRIIHSIRGTGELTISFRDGSMAGDASWRTSRKNNT